MAWALAAAGRVAANAVTKARISGRAVMAVDLWSLEDGSALPYLPPIYKSPHEPLLNGETVA